MEKADENADETVKRGIAIATGVMEKLEKSCEGFCVSAPVDRAAVALDSLKPFLK